MAVVVDVARVYARLEELADVGRVPGVGLWRRALTEAEGEAIRRVSAWMEAAGLEVRRDDAGNLFGRLRPAQEGPARRVLVGSHLDSVKNGGIYDGDLGVLGALGAVEALTAAHGRPRLAVEVVAWTGEEGSRFPGGFIGSKGFVGELGAEELDKRDDDGIALQDALESAGFHLQNLPSAPPDDVAAFLELHIEQGRVLESLGVPVGIVEGIVGMRQVRVTVSGRADHAGTTPMDLRADALRAAAAMMLEAAGRVEAAGPPAVVTCGRLEVRPGAANVVPADVRFTFDLRDADAERLRGLEAEIEADCRRLASKFRCACVWSCYHSLEPVPCDAGLVGLLEGVAGELGLGARRMVSGAGHDAMVLAPHVPAAMLFAPSRDGRSHCPEEYTAPEDAAPSLNVLAGALRQLAW